jgi:signal transduction histidine kinase
VLVILIDNALRALEDAAGPRLALSARAEGDRIVIGVDDSGPGVPPDILPRLFSPFVTSRKRTAGRAGTGLGLAIARGIVERHQGRIAAGRSALGGARFTITLPRAQALLGAAAGS